MIRLEQIVLFTKNKQQLAGYLSDLFDLEVEAHADAVRLANEDVSFLVIENAGLAAAASNMMMDFSVSTYDELIEYQRKVEFLNYRFASKEVDGKHENLALPQIKDLGEVKFFFLVDPDQRRWKISHIS